MDEFSYFNLLDGWGEVIQRNAELTEVRKMGKRGGEVIQRVFVGEVYFSIVVNAPTPEMKVRETG